MLRYQLYCAHAMTVRASKQFPSLSGCCVVHYAITLFAILCTRRQESYFLHRTLFPRQQMPVHLLGRSRSALCEYAGDSRNRARPARAPWHACDSVECSVGLGVAAEADVHHAQVLPWACPLSRLGSVEAVRYSCFVSLMDIVGRFACDHRILTMPVILFMTLPHHVRSGSSSISFSTSL